MLGNTAALAVVSLLGLQMLSLIAGALIYSRQKSALDVESRDRGSFKTLVDKAVALAGDAVAGVQRIDVDQYRALAKKLGEAYAEIEYLKAKITTLEERLTSLSNKVANSKRGEAQAQARPQPQAAAEAGSGDFEIPAGVDPLEFMKAHGLAQPLEGRVAYQQQVMPLNSVSRDFGKNAVR